MVTRVFQVLCGVILFFVFTSAFSETVFYTKSGARFQQVSQNAEGSINWVFLPGGPGLGSEYLRPFVDKLNLPGTTWLLDMPGDGSNTLGDRKVDYNYWPANLASAVKTLPNVILVAHSFAGMLTLSSPGLQHHLLGLVLIDTAPNHQWMTSSKPFQSKALLKAQKAYFANPSDQTLKSLTFAMAPYFFLEKDMKKGKALLNNLPYNNKAFAWASQYFDPQYEAKWAPEKIPVLIITGAQDHLTPVSLFENDQQFHRKNIRIVVIPNAAHFSWIGHVKLFNQLFKRFFHTR
ncbi:MAG: hypothetical protein COV52_03825 [Gammaproteobacteria bacterium CG11_big_fil_rev_8_21_14_0_20_46_22]|nr:MAG: hypothetical protein COW05_01875 [Gammaproteobacteria bacterium CG12_big_fil_rev_8_21_14_0_65_46_12]PIR11449.1 MAG: hypothetical protein COV52_03825 [Gammaproteobacteria bacterium CG11_big_fil_rev_8_21_14_0_20_46_22]